MSEFTKRGKLETIPRKPREWSKVALLAAILVIVLFSVGACVAQQRAVYRENKAHIADLEKQIASAETTATMLTDEIEGLRIQAAEDAQSASETIAAQRSAVASQAAEIQRLQAELTEVRRQLRARPATPPRAVPQSNRQGTGEWRTATASWYGPGFYGRRTSNGTVLTEGMMNVAGHGLPFGTMIEFRFNGKTAVAELNDRGPWVPNGRGGWNPHPIRKWDLGPGTATKLGFSGVQRVEYRILGNGG